MAKLTRASRATRRRHTNSKLGCSNCKRKKIRCDEKLPECTNCSRGKRETCSYLSLNQLEVNKIKLTHSLRSSQNKLLSGDYHLPTSSTNNSEALTGPILEFKFELENYPLRIPSFNYSLVLFHNLSGADFHDLYDETSQYQSEPVMASPTTNQSSLANHKTVKTSFKMLNYQKILRDLIMVPEEKKAFNGLDQNREVILSHFNHFILNLCESDPYFEVIHGSIFAFGYCTIFNEFQHRNTYDNRRSIGFVKKLKANCVNVCKKTLEGLETALSEFQKGADKMKAEEIFYFTRFFGVATNYISFALVLLDFDSDYFFKTLHDKFKVLQIYANLAATRKDLHANPIFNFLSANVQFLIKCITIPSYDPTFFREINRNLQDLSVVYRYFDDYNLPLHLASKQRRIKYQFECLQKYINELLIPVIFEAREEKVVTVYTPTTILELMRSLHIIFPSEAICFRSPLDKSDPEASIFLNDLSISLYMYYYCIAEAIDAVIPACRYLFSMSFVPPVNKSFLNCDGLVVNKNNLFHQKFKTQDTLQRHNYYSMRMFAYFRRRYNFYQRHVVWKTPYTDLLRQNRYKSRATSNSVEIPIKHFNTTLIRPEHFPTKSNTNSKSNNGESTSFFNRIDDTIAQKFYTRNIEKLDFFDKKSILQFDPKSMLLLRDYRPIDEDTAPQSTVAMHDVKEYYKDRNILLETLVVGSDDYVK